MSREGNEGKKNPNNHRRQSNHRKLQRATLNKIGHEDASRKTTNTTHAPGHANYALAVLSIIQCKKK